MPANLNGKTYINGSSTWTPVDDGGIAANVTLYEIKLFNPDVINLAVTFLPGPDQTLPPSGWLDHIPCQPQE